MIQHVERVIKSIEHGWGEKRVLVVGDLMLDKYISGQVSRISPEAPVPVVMVKSENYQAGGAGNVAMNLRRLGARPTVVGFIGADENGELLRECLNDNGIEARLTECPDYPTTTKLRILAGRQQILRLDTERAGAHERSESQSLLEDALHVLGSADVVILSDYAKGALDRDVCQRIIKAARAIGIPVLVDPKCPEFSIYAGATTICPNLAELAAALRDGTQDLKQLLARARTLVRDHNLEFLTATLSEKGIAVVREHDEVIAPAEVRQVFDVSGAGDTVISVLALCLASGIEPELGIQIANIAAGIVVGKFGTVPVERHELMAALSAELTLHTNGKLVDRDELLARVALWRKNGERIVFTNGCFDLLHVGHIAVLEGARRFGDRLVVGLNSDSSVKALKGPARPIVRDIDRARVIASLGVVDAVVIFPEKTPFDLIRILRPEVLVKGGDYAPDSIVGAAEVASWGGQVKIIPTIEGRSTTALIEAGKGDV